MSKIDKNSWIIKSPVAHRGLHNINEGIPENSLPAFSRAVERGYPIELDIHLTTDGKLFVLHDFNTERVCGRDFHVEGMDSHMLRDFKLMGTDFSIPLFGDVLEIVNGRVPILIEIKSESVHVGTLEDKLHNTLQSYKGQVAIESFNPLSVRYMGKKNPSYILGQLSYEFEGRDDIPPFVKKLLMNCRLNFLSRPDFIAYDINAMPKPFLKPLKDGGKTAVIGWTVRSGSDMKFAEKYCDNYIFEEER